MPAEGRITPQLIEAIQALLNAIGKEDDKWAEIDKAKTVLAKLGLSNSGNSQAFGAAAGATAGATPGATVSAGEVPRKDIDKEPGEGSGNVRPIIPHPVHK